MTGVRADREESRQNSVSLTTQTAVKFRVVFVVMPPVQRPTASVPPCGDRSLRAVPAGRAGQGADPAEAALGQAVQRGAPLHAHARGLR